MTGRLSIRVFQMLSAGKMAQPPRLAAELIITVPAEAGTRVELESALAVRTTPGEIDKMAANKIVRRKNSLRDVLNLANEDHLIENNSLP